MRIAVLTNVYPPQVAGGAGRVAFVYNELLRARGHEIRVWDARSEYAGLAKRTALARLVFHFFDLRSDRMRSQEIAQWKPDVVLTHNLTGCGFGTPRNVQRALLQEAGQNIRRVRWIHVLHDVQLIEPSGQIIEGESVPWVRAVWRRSWSTLRQYAMGEPDVVVSPTQWLLDFHRGFGWFVRCESTVIPNPIVVDSSIHPSADISNTNDVSQSEDAGPSVRDPRAILFVSRVAWDKGIDLLVESWKQLRDEASKLVIISDGPWRKRVEDLHDAKIDVRGQQTAEQVARAMRESAVVVLPSRVWENQPNVILEGLAAGCRIVATDVGGVRETLGDAGWIVQPNSVEGLIRGVRMALEVDGDAARSAARADVLRSHDPERCVARLERTLFGPC